MKRMTATDPRRPGVRLAVLLRMLGILLVVVLASGCVSMVYSLHPPYVRDDVVFDPILVGTWRARDWPDGTTDDTWAFRRAGQRAYRLTVGSGDEALVFDARLVRFDRFLFLDLVPNPPAAKGYGTQLIAAHLTLRVWITKDAVLVALLAVDSEDDWFNEGVRRGEIRVRHYRHGGDIILTGPTKDVRAFMIETAERPDAFKKALWLLRQE